MWVEKETDSLMVTKDYAGPLVLLGLSVFAFIVIFVSFLFIFNWALSLVVSNVEAGLVSGFAAAILLLLYGSFVRKAQITKTTFDKKQGTVSVEKLGIFGKRIVERKLKDAKEIKNKVVTEFDVAKVPIYELILVFIRGGGEEKLVIGIGGSEMKALGERIARFIGMKMADV